MPKLVKDLVVPFFYICFGGEFFHVESHIAFQFRNRLRNFQQRSGKVETGARRRVVGLNGPNFPLDFGC